MFTNFLVHRKSKRDTVNNCKPFIMVIFETKHFSRKALCTIVGMYDTSVKQESTLMHIPIALHNIDIHSNYQCNGINGNIFP